MKISQIKIVELGDFTFQVDFLLDDKNSLSTAPMAKDTTKDEVKNQIQMAVNSYLSQRADSNFTALKSAYENKTIII